jgi:hypothetical protein
MLAVGRNLWLMSTFFRFVYSAREQGGKEWRRVRVRALQCRRIGRDFLEAEKSAKGDFDGGSGPEQGAAGLSGFVKVAVVRPSVKLTSSRIMRAVGWEDQTTEIRQLGDGRHRAST